MSDDSRDDACQALDLHALRTDPGNRDERGRLRPGHTVNVKTGLRMRHDHPAVSDAIAERHDAVLADLGEHLTAMEAPLALELARVQAFTASAGEALAAHGLTTGKGAARAMVAIYERLLDKQITLARMLGLQRRAKLAGVAAIVATVKGGANGQP